MFRRQDIREGVETMLEKVPSIVCAFTQTDTKWAMFRDATTPLHFLQVISDYVEAMLGKKNATIALRWSHKSTTLAQLFDSAAVIGVSPSTPAGIIV